MRRVLFISPFNFVGGGQRWLETLVTRLPKYGIQPYIIFNRGHPGHPFWHWLRDLIIEEACFLYGQPKYHEVLAKAIAELRPHWIVIEHKEDLDEVFSILRRYRMRLPKVLHVRHVISGERDAEIQAISHLIDKVIAVSQAVQASITWTKADVIWNSVPLPKGLGVDVRQLCDIPKDAFVIGYLGRIDANKRVHLVVEAVRELGCYGLIVGSGPLVAKLRQLAQNYPKLKFMPVSVWYPYDWYKAMDVFVLPSIAEGFGLAPLEALLSGVRVVMTPIADWPKFSKKILFFDGTVQELKAKIKTCDYDPQEALEEVLGHIGSPDDMAKKYARVFSR